MQKEKVSENHSGSCSEIPRGWDELTAFSDEQRTSTENTLTANTTVCTHYPYSLCLSRWGVELCLWGLRVIRLVSVASPCPPVFTEPSLTCWGLAWLSQRLTGGTRHTLQSAGSRLSMMMTDCSAQEASTYCEHILRTCEGSYKYSSGRPCPSMTHFMGLYVHIWASCHN